MRQKSSRNGLTVRAVSGTHVVMLGLDLSDAARPGCLGFAIQREDHTEGERYWLSGSKTFEGVGPVLGPGGQVSTRQGPIQSFQWADYSAKPGHDYSYRVVAMHGQPGALTDGPSVTVRLRAEPEEGRSHTVYFNRGAVASQEYARRFQNLAPDQLPDPRAAYDWLSRGLLEAFCAFVQRARGKTWGLRGAIYECQWPGALQAIAAAAATGASVKIVYDGIAGGGPRQANEAAIAAAGLAGLCQPRTAGKIMHNKFVVLTRAGKPVAVWTGSTNLTENGLFGHLNCGHVIEDVEVAADYLRYWQQISADPAPAAERAWMAQHNPAPPPAWTGGERSVFSPRSGLDVLRWYGQIAGSAQQALFMTFAFGMHKTFQQVYERDDAVLRMALLEKEGNGAGLAQGRLDVRRIRARRNVVMAVGNNLTTNSFDRWLKERAQLTRTANVRFVHTKFMLVDPLGKVPVVVTGSANFSESSTNANEENMLVIRGNARVADIYLGEFMRSYAHYAFREAVAIAKEKGQTDWQPQWLVPSDRWQADHFRAGSARWLRRRYFAGTA